MRIKIIVESFDGSEGNHDWDNDRICSLTSTWRTLIVGHESICRHRDPENLSCANDVPFHFSPFYVSSPSFFSSPSFPNYEFTPKSSSSISLFYSNLSLETKKKKLIEREKLSIIKNHPSKHGVVFMHSPRNRSKSLEENRRSPHRIMHIRRALMVECSPWKSGSNRSCRIEKPVSEGEEGNDTSIS